MNIKEFTLSNARISPKHQESEFGPSMVDPTVHNPTIQEILERYTKTGQLNCSVRQAFYDDDDSDNFSPSEMFDDITDIMPSYEPQNEVLQSPTEEGSDNSKKGDSEPVNEQQRTKDDAAHESGE